LVPDDQLTAASAQQFAQLKQTSTLSSDPEYNAMVQRVGQRIAAVAGPDVPDADWEFIVIEDDDQVNAFAMPGGKVAVYTGLFKAVKSDDDLAIVMGHEVGHVVAGHGGERVSQQILASAGATAVQLGTGLSEMDSDDQQLIMSAYGAGATLGVLRPYSRLHESEADELGLMYAARAGYDPREAIPFWQRMDALSPGAPPEFLSTHPSGSTRIENLQRLMPQAMEAYRAATVAETP
jgi:predicted Zn-dependent protease